MRPMLMTCGVNFLDQKETAILYTPGRLVRNHPPFLRRICSRSLMGCLATVKGWGVGGTKQPTSEPPPHPGAVACCPLHLLTRALLMTSSHSEGRRSLSRVLLSMACKAPASPRPALSASSTRESAAPTATAAGSCRRTAPESSCRTCGSTT